MGSTRKVVYNEDDEDGHIVYSVDVKTGRQD